jgi:hypothetical protein
MGCILQLTWMAWRLAVTNAQMENIKKSLWPNQQQTVGNSELNTDE